MRQLIFVAMVAVFAMLLPMGAARAEHFRISLTVEAGDEVGSAPTDPIDKPDSNKPTPTFETDAGEPLTLQFIVENVYPHGTRKNIGIHYVIMRLGDVGADVKPPSTDAYTRVDPKSPGTILDGKFVQNFAPKARMGLRQQFRIAKPGVYLVRVESVNSQSDHEHFSQMLLTAK